MANTKLITETQLKLINLTNRMIMKNKIERNNLFSSKNGYPQFVIVFGFILLLAFFSVGNLRAQCVGKSLTYSLVNEPCNGNSLGAASVTFVGGTSQYSYSWSKGGVSVSTSPTSTITGLSAGSYTVVVQDNSSCQLTQVITITEPPALTGSAGVRLNVSCYGGNTGEATVSGSGGTKPYTFIWSNGATGDTARSLGVGCYTITVKDAMGCSKQLSGAAAPCITEPSAIAVAPASTSVKCFGGNDGTATVNVTGGIYPFSFNWSNGYTNSNTNTSTASNLSAATYTVSITDAKACAATYSVTITQSSLLGASTSVWNVQCNSGANGGASVGAFGGTSPYSYSWSTGQTTMTANNLLAGTHTCTVTDAKACVKTFALTVTEPPAFIIVSDTTNASCGNNNGTATVTVISGGTQPYSYSWSNGATSQTVSNLAPGPISVTVTDVNGCLGGSITPMIVRNPCNVWPGDADYNGIANNNDLLLLGLGYGDNGPVRPSATINWVGQSSPLWIKSFQSGLINENNVDCNGDGTINANDTTAIIKNYGLTHALKLAQPEYINGLPDLTFSIPTDTALSGSTIKVPIMLGTSTNQATGVYGLAFSIIYDPKIVDTTKLSLSLNGSWLGTNGTSLIYITKNFGKMGRMDVGITRIDHQNVSGFGNIGDLNIYMRDDISGKIASTLYKKLMLQAVQVKAISKDESIIQLNAGKDSIIVEQGITTGINGYNSSIEVKIYPNPASGFFTVDVNNSDIYEIKLVNIIGETVWQKNNNTENKIMVDTQALSAGTYYLSIVSSQGRIVKQVNIIK